MSQTEFLTEEQLVQAMHDPALREKAFAELIRKFQKQIYWFIRRMVINHEDANDLTQDVFIRVWEKFYQYRGEAKLIYWMYKIATNITLNFLDSKKRKLSISLDDEENPLVNRVVVRQSIDSEKLEMKLQEAILTLPNRQRAVFQLRYYDELPYQEMAEIFKLSTGALKASYFHAVRKVEQFIKDHD